eukprot:6178832-Pleurochrysis_carterae.AAC.1
MSVRHSSTRKKASRRADVVVSRCCAADTTATRKGRFWLCSSSATDTATQAGRQDGGSKRKRAGCAAL